MSMDDVTKQSAPTSIRSARRIPNLPFHPAVRAGDYIFVSGQVAKDADGNMIDGTIEEETPATIESIERILAEEGATLDDVVRVTTYLAGYPRLRPLQQGVRRDFKDAVLARTTVEARAVINTKIEMDAIAYKPLKK